MGLFLYSNTAIMPADSLQLFEFLPRDFVHTAGLVAMILVFLAGLATVINMAASIFKINGVTFRSCLNVDLKQWLTSIWEAVAKQGIAQVQYREECEEYYEQNAWYLRKWFVHAAAVWGFLGLLCSTGLDFLLDVIGVKPTGTFVPVWYPVRLLGTIAGIFLLYGVTVMIIQRLKQIDKSRSNSSFSDWVFLALLWLAGASGFLVELSLYLPQAMWGYWMLLVHVTFSIELLLLLPFSKFAHSFLRMAALFVHALKPAPAVETAQQVSSNWHCRNCRRSPKAITTITVPNITWRFAWTCYSARMKPGS